MELLLAKCCGSCKHVNKPKQPENHAPHYFVAKTERWCYKYEMHVTRESYCAEGYELEVKKGASPAFKRILKFNEKLIKIIKIKEWMVKNNIKELKDNEPYPCYFQIINNRLKRAYRYNECMTKWKIVSAKEKNSYNRLIKAYELYNKEK